MRKLSFYFLTLITLCSFNPCQADATEELKSIVKAEFIDTPHFEKMLAMIAVAQMEENNVDMPMDELIRKFKDLCESDETIARFYQPYQTFLTGEEIRAVADFYRTEASQKVMAKSGDIFLNYMTISKELIDLILKQDGIKKTVVAVENPNIISITEDNYVQEIERHSGNVVMVVTAQWCGACKLLKPVLEKISAKYAGTIKFATVDADKVRSLVSKYHVKALPTIFLIKNGRVLDKKTGFLAEDRFEELINIKFK